MVKKLKVINLFGEPGSGKSTLAMELTSYMKKQGESVEYVNEYAKYLTWANRKDMLNDQGYIFAKQNHMLNILNGQVEYVVTDSPLFLSLIYAGSAGYFESFDKYIMEVFNSYENINFLLSRDHEYVSAGRNQTEMESGCIKEYLIDTLKYENISYEELVSTEVNIDSLYKTIIRK